MGNLRRILLAEDSLNDIMLTRAALEEITLANALDVVRDGAEALDYLFCQGAYANRDTGTPIVMLLDLKMPKVDGMEVLRQIRARSDFKTLPVVILTSSREESDLVAGYSIGANAYVVKPVDFGDFVAAIRQLGLFWGVTNEVPGTVLGK